MSEPTTTEQRKDEMFAAQTLSGHLSRRIYEAQVRADPLEAIVALMDQKAALDARVQLLSHEIHNEITYSGLGRMLQQVVDIKTEILAGQGRLQAAWEETARGLGKLEERQDALIGTVSDHEERIASIEETREWSIANQKRLEQNQERLEKGRKENHEAILQVAATANRIEALLAPYTHLLTEEERAKQAEDQAIFERMKRDYLAREAGNAPAE